jgi:hypothetical protein
MGTTRVDKVLKMRTTKIRKRILTYKRNMKDNTVAIKKIE